jgi:formate dehydrogenase subunit delta
MHSPNDTLVRMANQIGKFFAAQGEERAIAGIADHVKKFWEPRMKKQIFAYLDEGGEGLTPLTLKALQSLKTAMHGKSTAAEALAAAQAASQGGAPNKAAAPQPAHQAKAKAGSNGKSARR